MGSRGETPDYFADSLDFIASLDVQHLHVFPYSERPGTTALSIPYVVDARTKSERVARMIELSNRKQREFIDRYVGTCRPVLIEQSAQQPVMHGFTDNYIRVNVARDDRYVNRIVPVQLLSVNDDLSVEARIVE